MILECNTHLFVDITISVDIIEIKCPLEFLSDGASQQDGQSSYKVLMEEKDVKLTEK